MFWNAAKASSTQAKWVSDLTDVIAGYSFYVFERTTSNVNRKMVTT